MYRFTSQKAQHKRPASPTDLAFTLTCLGWTWREARRPTQGQAFQESELFSRQGRVRLAVDWLGLSGRWRQNLAGEGGGGVSPGVPTAFHLRPARTDMSDHRASLTAQLRRQQTHHPFPDQCCHQGTRENPRGGWGCCKGPRVFPGRVLLCISLGHLGDRCFLAKAEAAAHRAPSSSRVPCFPLPTELPAWVCGSLSESNRGRSEPLGFCLGSLSSGGETETQEGSARALPWVLWADTCPSGGGSHWVTRLFKCCFPSTCRVPGAVLDTRGATVDQPSQQGVPGAVLQGPHPAYTAPHSPGHPGRLPTRDGV
ncbi:uncharacterized protein LOC123579947 [Leopardus geoffroyi]|uniref:uncharacterized protein LOC123579947 n=1 Tax=Leopardus geoffroyi TaxID=46844 RepID=UPI001E264C82|nr:uncharacterized protein LOC123579947 [Leopardus geoffroyi]